MRFVCKRPCRLYRLQLSTHGSRHLVSQSVSQPNDKARQVRYVCMALACMSTCMTSHCCHPPKQNCKLCCNLWETAQAYQAGQQRGRLNDDEMIFAAIRASDSVMPVVIAALPCRPNAIKMCATAAPGLLSSEASTEPQMHREIRAMSEAGNVTCTRRISRYTRLSVLRA